MTRFQFVLAAMAAAFLCQPSLAQTPVQITADTFVVEEASSQAVFTGNVVVKHPTVNVWANKVVASYGDGGTSDIKTFEATGKVKPADQLLRLTGNVEVTNSGGTVQAQELVVNLETNVSTFTAGQGGRVTGVFTSQ
jgi:lipopolysaccharide export system protein LptA